MIVVDSWFSDFLEDEQRDPPVTHSQLASQLQVVKNEKEWNESTGRCVGGGEAKERKNRSL